MDTLIRKFTEQQTWAVVGVSTNPDKYGHKILLDLDAAGYHVYGINIRGGQVKGHELYRSLADLPVKPQVVDIVVPPAQTIHIVRECARLGLLQVWMQPGAESEQAIQFCHENGIEVVHGACAMIRKRNW